MATAAIAAEKAAEWYNLAGDPTFDEIGKGRYRCVESGHELKKKEVDLYKKSKHCRIAVIDHAISVQKPPFNIFTQNHLSRSKLICKLTGDTINKTEKHIWMHINGKRFFKKLEEKEVGCVGEKEMGDLEKELEENSNKKNKKNKNKKKKKNKNKKKKKKKHYPDEGVDHDDDDFEISRGRTRRDINGGKRDPDSGIDVEDYANGEETEVMTVATKERSHGKKRVVIEEKKVDNFTPKKRKKPRTTTAA